MPLTRPTLSTLRTQARSDLVSRFPALDNQLRRSLVNAVADVLAGMVFLLWGFLVWIATQLLPDTAEGQWLERWLAIKDITRTAAAAWSGTWTVGGTVDATPIPSGTVLVRGDGVQFVTTADGALSSLTATIPVQAAIGGADGNCDTGTVLLLGSAIAGVSASGTVASTVTVGVDAESDDAVRARLLLALRKPPAGGTADDYIEWTLGAGIGATRAWCFPLEGGDGTVTVRFAMDNASYGPIPNSGDVSAVAAYIAPRAPVAAVVTVVAPGDDAVDFTIANLAVQPGFTLTKVRNNIKASLADLFMQAGSPGGTVLLELMSDAITRAAGVAGFDLTTPSADETSATHAIPTLGTVTWT